MECLWQCFSLPWTLGIEKMSISWGNPFSLWRHHISNIHWGKVMQRIACRVSHGHQGITSWRDAELWLQSLHQQVEISCPIPQNTISSLVSGMILIQWKLKFDISFCETHLPLFFSFWTFWLMFTHVLFPKEHGKRRDGWLTCWHC